MPPFHPVRTRPLTLHHPQRLDAEGVVGPTRGQARRGRWVRTGPGLYVPVTVDRTRPEQRAVELAARYAGGVPSGWGALWLLGGAFFDGLGPDGRTPRPLVVVLREDTGRRKSSGVRLSYEPLQESDETVVAGTAVTAAVRALFDEVRVTEDAREAVVAIDMAAAARLVAPEHLAAYARARRRWRRTDGLRGLVSLASECSRSPNESRLRLVWQLDAGLPRPLVNQDVFERSGRFVCTADLLDPVAGLVVEYDGAEHGGARRRSRDAARQEHCRRVGLEYVVVTRPDLDDRDLLVDRLTSARSRARFADPATRAWTTEPPQDRPPSLTWAEERELEAWLRSDST